MQSIMIVAQRPIIRLGIKSLLQKTFANFLLTDYECIGEAKFKDEDRQPDLIFLGVEGDLGGQMSLIEARRIYRESDVIVYDVQGEPDSGIKYLKYGAKGYLSKTSDLSVMRSCIEQVLSGKLFIDPADLYTLLTGLSDDSIRSRQQLKGRVLSTASQRGYRLTNNQQKIALMLAEGLRTSKIAEYLGLKPSTVSTVKSTIYSKMNVNNIVHLKNKLVERGMVTFGTHIP